MLRRVLSTAAAVVFIIAAAALIERAMGRGFWCPAGDRALYSVDVNSIHNSQHLADPYAMSHVVHGFLFYLLFWAVGRFRAMPQRRKVVGAVLLEAAWEVLENSTFIINRYREATLAVGYRGDSIVNSISDAAWMLLGFWLAGKLKPRHSVAFVILLELVSLAWVRDNLALNILMLTYPIAAVKQWQLAL